MMQNRVRWMLWTALAATLALGVLGVCVGSVGLENLLHAVLDPASDPERAAMARQIVWDIRLPRTLGAWAAGALALGAASALLLTAALSPPVAERRWAAPTLSGGTSAPDSPSG